MRYYDLVGDFPLALARALKALIEKDRTPEEAERTLEAALAIIAEPAVGDAEQMQRLRRLRALVNFGAIDRDAGHA